MYYDICITCYQWPRYFYLFFLSRFILNRWHFSFSLECFCFVCLEQKQNTPPPKKNKNHSQHPNIRSGTAVLVDSFKWISYHIIRTRVICSTYRFVEFGLYDLLFKGLHICLFWIFVFRDIGQLRMLSYSPSSTRWYVFCADRQFIRQLHSNSIKHQMICSLTKKKNYLAIYLKIIRLIFFFCIHNVLQ